MHGAARPDAFDDLLPDIASLAKVEGPVLLCFLRQIPLANIYAIGRDARFDPLQFEGLESNGSGACPQQHVPQLPHVF